MVEILPLEKSTKYLLLLMVLIFAMGIILTVQGLLEPRQTQVDVFVPKAPVTIDENLLNSPNLDDLRTFQPIDHPSAQIGRRDLFSWPDPSESEDEL